MNRENSEVILKTLNLHKSYFEEKRELRILRGIDLEIKKGEFLSVVGASGTGKSTLLHLLGGLDRPTRGQVFLKGKKVFQLNDEKLAKLRNRQVGFIFQFHYLLPEFSALENTMMPALISSRERENRGREGLQKIREKAQNILSELGLGKRINHKPSELSGGESQRVAVARALINEPDIILADEPTSCLDTENGRIVMGVLAEFRRQAALVVCSHDPRMLANADIRYRMEDGTLSPGD